MVAMKAMKAMSAMKATKKPMKAMKAMRAMKTPVKAPKKKAVFPLPVPYPVPGWEKELAGWNRFVKRHDRLLKEGYPKQAAAYLASEANRADQN